MFHVLHILAVIHFIIVVIHVITIHIVTFVEPLLVRELCQHIIVNLHLQVLVIHVTVKVKRILNVRVIRHRPASDTGTLHTPAARVPSRTIIAATAASAFLLVISLLIVWARDVVGRVALRCEHAAMCKAPENNKVLLPRIALLLALDARHVDFHRSGGAVGIAPSATAALNTLWCRAAGAGIIAVPIVVVIRQHGFKGALHLGELGHELLAFRPRALLAPPLLSVAR